jgi:hypothetical protein
MTQTSSSVSGAEIKLLIIIHSGCIETESAKELLELQFVVSGSTIQWEESIGIGRY